MKRTFLAVAVVLGLSLFLNSQSYSQKKDKNLSIVPFSKEMDPWLEHEQQLEATLRKTSRIEEIEVKPIQI